MIGKEYQLLPLRNKDSKLHWASGTLCWLCEVSPLVRDSCCRVQGCRVQGEDLQPCLSWAVSQLHLERADTTAAGAWPQGSDK